MGPLDRSRARKGVDWWFQKESYEVEPSERNFCFGPGASQTSRGTVLIHIQCKSIQEYASGVQIISIEVDIVDAAIPMLISLESLQRMHAVIDFQELQLTMHNEWTIPLIQTPSGHLMLNGIRAKVSDKPQKIYAVAKTEVAPRVLTYQELRRIHVSLGRCAQNTMTTLLRAAHIQVNHQQLHELYRKCGRADSVYRITPPQVSCRMAKYNGEIVGMGIIFPFVKKDDSEGGSTHDKRRKPALFTIDCLSRFINRTMPNSLECQEVTQTFINDWVRALGKPRRTILDNG